VSRELRDALHERLEASSSDYRELRDGIASARSVLLIGALVYLANGIFAFAASSRRQFETEEDHELSLYLLLFDIVCGTVFAVIWWLAKNRPALAILLAGVFWVAIQALVAIAIPATIVTGLWLKGIVVILLVRGIVAAVRANAVLKSLDCRRRDQRRSEPA
jgi:peptidoglycan/LPS O-acetylase OafA/YrhL